jgi:hypothetical protein
MQVSFTVWDSNNITIYHQILLNDGIAEVTVELSPGETFYGVSFGQFMADGSGLMEVPVAPGKSCKLDASKYSQLRPSRSK